MRIRSSAVRMLGVVVLTSTLAALACTREQASTPTSPQLDMPSLATAEAGVGRVEVCHYRSDEGDWRLRLIGQPALSMHLANHDDAIPGGTTSQTETTLDMSCGVLIALEIALEAVGNDTANHFGNPLSVDLVPGNYVVTVVSGAWSAWSITTCTNLLEPCLDPDDGETGWLTAYRIGSNDIVNVLRDGGPLSKDASGTYLIWNRFLWSTAANALADASIAHFTLPVAATVEFSISDGALVSDDNRGGPLTLSIQAVP